MPKIFIDPGHGGKDSGAADNGLLEKNITLYIALRMKYILEDEYTNAQVKLSREKDVYVGLSERAQMANAWGADYFVSIHVNAGGGTGFESYVHSSRPSRTVAYQNVMHEAIMGALRPKGIVDRGKKAANFTVLQKTKMPAILTENLFIDNSNDASLLKDPEFLGLVARAHVTGLERAFGLKRKAWEDENDVLQRAVVINSFADFPAAEQLARKYKAPIFLASFAAGNIAETVYIVGGSANGIKAKQIVNLSGKNRYETAQKVGKYLGVL